jgi:hypothetical protein
MLTGILVSTEEQPMTELKEVNPPEPEKLEIGREAACIIITPDTEGAAGVIRTLIPEPGLSEESDAVGQLVKLMLLFATDDSEFMKAARVSVASHLESEGKFEVERKPRVLH